MCQQAMWRPALTAALPQLRRLDGRPVNAAEALQYQAAMQLQSFQPLVSPVLQLLPPPEQRQTAAVSLPVAPEPAADAAPTDADTACLLWPAGVAHCSLASLPAGNRDHLAVGAGHAAGPAADQPKLGSQLGVRSTAPGAQGHPEQVLHHLLQACPQLAAALSAALSLQRHGASGACEGAMLAGTSTVAVQTEGDSGASSGGREQLGHQVAELHDEVEALTAELDLQAQGVRHAEAEAAATVLHAGQQAEARVRQAEGQAASAVEATLKQLAGVQQQCTVLEQQLVDLHGRQVEGQQRQRDLEYELARAWEELEHSEALRHQLTEQAMQTEAREQQVTAVLAHSREAGKEAARRLEQAEQGLEEQRAALAQQRAEREAVAAAVQQQVDPLKKQVESLEGQLGQQRATAAEAHSRERDQQQQLLQLSATLAGLRLEQEAAVAALHQQQQRELEMAAAKQAAAVRAVQDERDTVQRQLAGTEAEFRCALQVW